jgi:hypothetical protein
LLSLLATATRRFIDRPASPICITRRLWDDHGMAGGTAELCKLATTVWEQKVKTALLIVPMKEIRISPLQLSQQVDVAIVF